MLNFDLLGPGIVFDGFYFVHYALCTLTQVNDGKIYIKPLENIF